MMIFVWLKHNHIQWLGGVWWKPKRSNAVAVAALNKFNGMMGAVAIQKKKSFRALCELS